MTLFFEFYKKIVDECFTIFLQKLNNYGESFKIFRIKGIIDQVFIKINRIKYIENYKDIKITNEPIEETLKSAINYSIIGLILIDNIKLIDFDTSISLQNILYEKEMHTIVEHYNKKIEDVYNLILNKNNDYDNAWEQMYISSFTDIILVKISRMKHAIDTNNKDVSFIIEDGFMDIINYLIFYLYKLSNILK